MRRDFRAEAAEATLSKLASVGGGSLADLDESGCVEIPGGTRLRYLTEVPGFLTIIGCWILLLGAWGLMLMGVISQRMALAITLIGFAVSLVFRKVRSLVLKSILSGRRDGFVKNFPDLPSRAVAIEDGKTVQKIKFLTEDEGVCLLDAQRQRVLIEGCSYRHVIYAKDVFSVGPVSGYALSGARLVCRMGSHEVDMVLKTSGQGPLASLGQAFAPAAGAEGLATVLNRTLFGSEVASYRQSALPPPLPQG